MLIQSRRFHSSRWADNWVSALLCSAAVEKSVRAGSVRCNRRSVGLSKSAGIVRWRGLLVERVRVRWEAPLRRNGRGEGAGDSRRRLVPVRRVTTVTSPLWLCWWKLRQRSGTIRLATAAGRTLHWPRRRRLLASHPLALHPERSADRPVKGAIRRDRVWVPMRTVRGGCAGNKRAEAAPAQCFGDAACPRGHNWTCRQRRAP